MKKKLRRKFKSRPFKKPPTPKVERKRKATKPAPFARQTLYINPREKQEQMSESALQFFASFPHPQTHTHTHTNTCTYTHTCPQPSHNACTICSR